MDEQIYQELEMLRQEVAALKTESAASEAQRELLEKVVVMARSPAQEEVLKVTLQETLDVSTKMAGAETGSLFLLDRNGAVTDSILTQRGAAEETRQKLIGNVLDKGLAGWVNRNRQVGLIIDTETDDRWLTLPNQPYTVRSALAVPILRGEDLLGILTLLHCEPARFSEETAHLLQVTADQMALVLENAQLYGKLEESYRELDQANQKTESLYKALDNELEKGRQIQRDFLPNTIPQPQNWEICACFYPARQVAGDFYDAFMLPGDYVGLVIADVCDKGVGAALFMALFRSLIRVFSGQTSLAGLSTVGMTEQVVCIVDPSITTDLDQINALKAVPLANNYIAEEHAEMSMFATLFFGVLNPTTGTLTYINGGHEPLFIINNGVIKNQLNPTGPAVGMLPNVKFKVKQVQLDPEDLVIGYTDGVTEAHAPDGKLFSNERLLGLLKQPTDSASELVERIKGALFTYMEDAPQFDDITMLSVRRLG
jgi:sigma-B regulation protein RsbU (phosphoserine phosphatase)